MNASDMDLRSFLLLLWRRRLLIVGLVLCSVAAVFIFVNIVTPKYSAKALVMIEGQAASAAAMKPESATVKVDPAFILSEAEVLKSRALAAKVIRKLGLMNDAEFNPGMRFNNTFLSMFMESAEEARTASFKTLSIYPKNPNDAAPDQRQGEIIDRFLSRLRVRQVLGSSVIQIEFVANDARKSALIANAITDSYIEQRLETKYANAQKTQEWLSQRLLTLRDQVRFAEDKLERYRAAHNLSLLSNGDLGAQEMAALNKELTQAKANLAEIDGRIKDPVNRMATEDVLGSRVIQELTMQEAVAMQTLSELAGRYGEKHPKMMKARAELENIRSKMKEESSTIAQSLKNERAIAASQITALEQKLGEAQSSNNTSSQASIKLRDLAADVQSSQAVLDAFLQTYKKSEEQELLQDAQARVISYATIPGAPAYPNKPLFLSLAVVGSFFMGIGLALLAEKLDHSIRTISALEGLTGHACCGLVPWVHEKNLEPMADYILDQPLSPVAESLRALRLKLKPAKVVTVTSSLPGEGKTTLSAWLARLAAKSGERVIVVDTDMRRPFLHKTFGRPMEKPLCDFLSGKITLEECIRKDTKTGLHLITAGSSPENALDLLSGDKMKRLIASLRGAYDLVIIDSPACLAVADTRAIAASSDTILYAVAWEDTPREVVVAGLRQFEGTAAQIMSVLSHVDLKRHARYGYGDVLYYYGKQYYQPQTL